MMFPKGKYSKQKTAYKRSQLPENKLQKMCEEYLEQRLLTYIRIPDCLNAAIFGCSSNIPVYIKSLIASFTKGVPDLTVLNKDGRYLCIELKTESGKQSLAQKKWSFGVGDNYHIIRSFEAFKSLIDEWI